MRRTAAVPARHALLAALLAGLLAPVPGRAQDGAAAADSAGGTAAPRSMKDLIDRAKAQPDSAAADSSAAAATGPIVRAWTRTPTARLATGVRTVRWEGGLATDMLLRNLSVVTADAKWAREKYRQQDKIVEMRDGTLHYADAPNRRFHKDLTLLRSWSEDRTVNTAGSANVSRRDFRQAQAALDSLVARAGPVRLDARLRGRYDDQKQSSLGIRNDYREALGSGGVLARTFPARGVSLAVTAYGEKVSGTRALGVQSSASSSSGDSLSGFVGYNRGGVVGAVTARLANFDRRYLDYRRNANGIIDTLGVAQKIVQELEENDALALEWRNDVMLGSFGLQTTVGRDVKRNSFTASGVGRKEDQRDHLRAAGDWSAARDTVTASYEYTWRWDDQTYRDATVSRGRQMNKTRELLGDWRHRLFAHTAIKLRWQLRLDQQIAERQFNDNDRDRYENNFAARIGSEWKQNFQTTMIFYYRHVEDIAIRRSRSSSNNFKDTYEVVPGYFWPLASWLQLRQDYRISIQYTDYVYDALPTVSQNDDYNKRGHLNTRVTLKPAPKLTFTVGHDYSVRSNASKVTQDAAGNTSYTPDLRQRISTVSLGVTYQVESGFTLEGATERTKDLKDTFGTRATRQTRYSGQVWVGGVYSRTWGGAGSGRTISSRIRKYYAYGPNVQVANADYWDADISLGWKF